MQEQDYANQRKTPRIPFVRDITFHEPWHFVARGIDIGAGGIGVEADVALEVGQQVEVEIFPDYAKAYGEVRWVLPVAEGYRFGVMFSAEDWSVIELVYALKEQEG
jgi:hypothetical protein